MKRWQTLVCPLTLQPLPDKGERLTKKRSMTGSTNGRTRRSLRTHRWRNAPELSGLRKKKKIAALDRAVMSPKTQDSTANQLCTNPHRQLNGRLYRVAEGAQVDRPTATADASH